MPDQLFNRTGRDSRPGFLMQVAMGLVPDCQGFHMEGKHDVLSDDYETIWKPGGLYTFPVSAVVITAQSSSPDDDPTGVGARTIRILGLDSDYNLISEIVDVTPNLGTPVYTTQEFFRVIYAEVWTAGSTQEAQGTISILGSTTLAVITPPQNESSMCVVTTPNKYWGMITEYTMTIDTAKESIVQATFKTVDRIIHRGPEMVVTAPEVFHYYEFPIMVPPKTDIVLNGKVKTGADIDIYVYFNTIFIHEKYVGAGVLLNPVGEDA